MRVSIAGEARMKYPRERIVTMDTSSKALVLSGGGTAGGAWMTGLISGLRRGGIDLGDADLIVGTSAGARTAAQLATGVLDQAVEMYRSQALPAVELHASLGEWVAASMRIIADAPDEREAARRIANMDPLGGRLASEADRRRMVAALLPVRRWPARKLLITAVDAGTGQRAAFGKGSGADLADAVLASGALPGIYPLVTIGGRRYADGGAHSLYNADLAAGHDVVTVLSPMPLDDYLRAKLDAEVATLGPATVRVITADEQSLAAIGPNALSAAAARAALEAGLAQARRESAALRTVWPAPARTSPPA
jgi:NTE family protein